MTSRSQRPSCVLLSLRRSKRPRYEPRRSAASVALVRSRLRRLRPSDRVWAPRPPPVRGHRLRGLVLPAAAETTRSALPMAPGQGPPDVPARRASRDQILPRWGPGRTSPRSVGRAPTPPRCRRSARAVQVTAPVAPPGLPVPADRAAASVVRPAVVRRPEAASAVAPADRAGAPALGVACAAALVAPVVVLVVVTAAVPAGQAPARVIAADQGADPARREPARVVPVAVRVAEAAVAEPVARSGAEEADRVRAASRSGRSARSLTTSRRQR
jgi:hypothetical protein